MLGWTQLWAPLRTDIVWEFVEVRVGNDTLTPFDRVEVSYRSAPFWEVLLLDSISGWVGVQEGRCAGAQEYGLTAPTFPIDADCKCVRIDRSLVACLSFYSNQIVRAFRSSDTRVRCRCRACVS